MICDVLLILLSGGMTLSFYKAFWLDKKKNPRKIGWDKIFVFSQKKQTLKMFWSQYDWKIFLKEASYKKYI